MGKILIMGIIGLVAILGAVTYLGGHRDGDNVRTGSK